MISSIRRLNDRGGEALRGWLEEGATGAPPLALLDDPAMSDPVPLAIARPEASFESRYDLGVELVELLDVLDVAEVQVDAGLWDWLSLCLIDQICPPDEAGRRKLGQIDRYLLHLQNHKNSLSPLGAQRLERRSRAPQRSSLHAGGSTACPRGSCGAAGCLPGRDHLQTADRGDCIPCLGCRSGQIEARVRWQRARFGAARPRRLEAVPPDLRSGLDAARADSDVAAPRIRSLPGGSTEWSAAAARGRELPP